jgi:hypothetical protein
VYLSGEGTAESGLYESDVLDAGAATFWGELSWTAELPAGSSLLISTRSGNASSPDEGWSEWSRVHGEVEGRIESPPGRFLQWMAEFSRGRGGTPALRGVEAAFVRENLPPKILSVRVYEPGDVTTNGGGLPTSASQRLPSGVEVTYTLDAQEGQSGTVPALLRGVRTAEWDALDPNGDALEFEIWLRSEDEDDWKLMTDGVDRTAHTWDSSSMPDGRYGLRVVATDRPGNPSGDAATAEAVSPPFVVDNTPPEFSSVEVSEEEGTIHVTGEVVDVWTQIGNVEVAVDYGEWKEAAADDGGFDSRNEGFGVRVEPVTGGEHAVAVRAIDRAGNVAVVRKVLK